MDLRNKPRHSVRLDGFSLETTGKDIDQLVSAAPTIPPGTPINIAFLGNETHDQRVAAAAIIRDCGFEPVPIISARRLESWTDLDGLLTRLRSAAAPRRFMFVGGDPTSPAGPFRDSLDLLASDVLRTHNIRDVVIAGYPEGHPRIGQDQLWVALREKANILERLGCSCEITLQYCLTPGSVVTWIRKLRMADIDAPVRIGVPGPTPVERLIRFARQFGVTVPEGFDQTTSVASEVSFADFLQAIERALEAAPAGNIGLHLYPFGGFVKATDWLEHYRHRPSA
jgi:methylenetetrahydrofolate reductase (NADPH)